MKTMKHLIATTLLMCLVSLASTLNAQLIFRMDSTGKGKIRSVMVERMNNGSGSKITVIDQTGKKRSTIVKHFGPNEAYERPDSSLLVMTSPTTYERHAIYQDADLLLVPILGYDGMHCVYPLKLQGGELKQMRKEENIYWQIMSRWHYPYLIYDHKRNQLIDFNRKNWVDFRNLSAGVYRIGKDVIFRGEIQLKQDKEMDLHIKDNDISSFYKEFIPIYLKKQSGKLLDVDGNNETPRIRGDIRRFRL